MGATQLAIKTRMRSIDATKKITKAMQLVASAKLKKQKDALANNALYAAALVEVAQNIVCQSCEDNIYTNQQDGAVLHVVISSDMGLCGGYNANICKAALAALEADDGVIVIGGRGVSWLKAHHANIIDTYINLKEKDQASILEIGRELINHYINGTYKKIVCWYTDFINSIVYEVKAVTMLPLTSSAAPQLSETIFEPSAAELLNSFVPQYIPALLNSYYIKSKTSEQATRRMSMESATDNAEALKGELLIQYNQARQAAITQELSEIIGGVEAMKGKE